MSVIIRRAQKKDCPRLLELVKELAEYEKAPDEVTVSLAHFIESGFGKHPVWWAFVAESLSSPTLNPSPEERENNKPLIVGFALYYIRYSTWKGQRMYLEDIIVSKEYRGKGIGKMLFDKLIEEGKQRHFNGMIWQVLEWNEPAIHFYEKYHASFDKEWWNGSIDF
ncbi:MAG: GNAT family N-acetyltransferase [Chitinophagaceae bacterium]|nr:MAG: GNAT family N-acetyltransferase [Chitinophagaceae bacterium]